MVLLGERRYVAVYDVTHRTRVFSEDSEMSHDVTSSDDLSILGGNRCALKSECSDPTGREKKLTQTDRQ